RKMVDAIYAEAELKLSPEPIPPTPAMTTVAVFSNHNSVVCGQRMIYLPAHPLGELVAGHKKDIVITPRLQSATNKVAIYGWPQTNRQPIQPLYLDHSATWVDYSQCTRLIQQKVLVNGVAWRLSEALSNPEWAALFSDEGVITNPRYPTNSLILPPAQT